MKDVAVVLKCAGPYDYPAEPRGEGCLRSRVYCLDLSGGVPVYEALQAKDKQAKGSSVTLLPTTSFDRLPSDRPDFPTPLCQV